MAQDVTEIEDCLFLRGESGAPNILDLSWTRSYFFTTPAFSFGDVIKSAKCLYVISRFSNAISYKTFGEEVLFRISMSYLE